MHCNKVSRFNVLLYVFKYAINNNIITIAVSAPYGNIITIIIVFKLVLVAILLYHWHLLTEKAAGDNV